MTRGHPARTRIAHAKALPTARASRLTREPGDEVRAIAYVTLLVRAAPSAECRPPLPPTTTTESVIAAPIPAPMSSVPNCSGGFGGVVSASARDASISRRSAALAFLARGRLARGFGIGCERRFSIAGTGRGCSWVSGSLEESAAVVMLEANALNGPREWHEGLGCKCDITPRRAGRETFPRHCFVALG